MVSVGMIYTPKFIKIVSSIVGEQRQEGDLTNLLLCLFSKYGK
jgi:hypothetical protein